jgi:mannose-6-phosphate isomerase
LIAEAGFEVRRVSKPWGHELIWALSDHYCGKVLVVRAGEELSLQFHRDKDETIYLHRGSAEIDVGYRGRPLFTEVIEVGQAFRIRPGTIHRLRAIEDCEFLEVSTPHLDDVVRLEDRYGRLGRAGAATRAHEQPVGERPTARLRAVGDSELTVDPRQVDLHRRLRQP